MRQQVAVRGLWDATNGSQGQVLAQVYRYDQLNRLKKARAVEGLTAANDWAAVTDAAANRYRSQYEYDANGNITSVQRYDADENHYDDFSYKYEKRGGRVVRNRLYQLNDLADQADAFVNEAGGAKDIGWTGILAFNEENTAMNTAYNYGYDALGNLIRDTREGITNIQWNIAGKVRSITKATGPSLAFAYGASGQPIQKQVSDPDLDDAGYREHYIRDAQGNLMATYRYRNTMADGLSLKLNERPLYGSSRLGSLRKEEELHSLPAFDPEDANPVQNIDLNYELTDHLGNVCAVVTGRLLDGNGGGTPKQPELLSAQGYEPFGSLLPGRNYSSDSYRFGFGGMPKDDEMHNATGTSYDFGARLYDPRVGRWLSLDPMASEYAPVSPYVFSLDNPILFRDVNGKWVVGSDGKPVTYTKSEDGTIQWSSNATEDVQRIGNAMLTTTTGTEAFTFWQDHSKEVHLVLDQKKKPGAFGRTWETKKSIKSVIYLRSIQEKTDHRFVVNPDDPSLSIDLEESIGAIGTHERWHPDPEQTVLDQTTPGDGNQLPSQNKPINAELNFKREYHQAKGKVFDESQYNGPDEEGVKSGYFGLDENKKPQGNP